MPPKKTPVGKKSPKATKKTPEKTTKKSPKVAKKTPEKTTKKSPKSTKKTPEKTAKKTPKATKKTPEKTTKKSPKAAKKTPEKTAKKTPKATKKTPKKKIVTKAALRKPVHKDVPTDVLNMTNKFVRRNQLEEGLKGYLTNYMIDMIEDLECGADPEYFNWDFDKMAEMLMPDYEKMVGLTFKDFVKNFQLVQDEFDAFFDFSILLGEIYDGSIQVQPATNFFLGYMPSPDTDKLAVMFRPITEVLDEWAREEGYLQDDQSVEDYVNDGVKMKKRGKSDDEIVEFLNEKYGDWAEM